MGGLARDLKQDDVQDAGFDLLMDQVTSPVTADVGVTRICVGTSTTYVPMDSSNPGYMQLTAGSASIGVVDLGATDNAVLDAIAASVAGTVTVDGSGVTQPVSGTVTANLSATDNAVLDSIFTAVSVAQIRDRLTDNMGVALQTDAILNDTTALTPKFAAINATVNGDNTVVAAVVGKKVRVLAYTLVADAAVGCAFEDGAGGSELAGQMAFAANGGISCNFNPVGWFETTANTLLNLETDAAANVRGHLVYVEV